MLGENNYLVGNLTNQISAMLGEVKKQVQWNPVTSIFRTSE